MERYRFHADGALYRVVNEAAGSESVEGRETCGRAERRGQETRAERERPWP